MPFFALSPFRVLLRFIIFISWTQPNKKGNHTWQLFVYEECLIFVFNYAKICSKFHWRQACIPIHCLKAHTQCWQTTRAKKEFDWKSENVERVRRSFSAENNKTLNGRMSQTLSRNKINNHGYLLCEHGFWVLEEGSQHKYHGENKNDAIILSIE